MNEDIETIPTIGFNVETVSFNNCKFIMWDFGGAENLRDYWKQHYSGVNAIIYVISVFHNIRLEENK
jgi:ADP-ribosylation factor-like protein 1